MKVRETKEVLATLSSACTSRHDGHGGTPGSSKFPDAQTRLGSMRPRSQKPLSHKYFHGDFAWKPHESWPRSRSGKVSAIRPRALNCPNPWSRSVDIPVLAMFAPSLPDMANLLVIHEAYGVLSADTSGSRAYHRPDLTHPIAGRCDARMPRPIVRCCSCSLHERGSTGLRDRATTMSLGRRGAALSRAERSDT
jgi:hypothetical protein